MAKTIKFGSFGLQLAIYFEEVVELDLAEAIEVCCCTKELRRLGKQYCVSFSHSSTITTTGHHDIFPPEFIVLEELCYIDCFKEGVFLTLQLIHC